MKSKKQRSSRKVGRGRSSRDRLIKDACLDVVNPPAPPQLSTSKSDSMATDADVSLQTKLHHFIGTWKFETSENFEEYMKAVEVNHLMRKIGKIARPQIVISVNKDEVTFRAHIPLITHKVTFKLGEEFVETTPDGRRMQTIFELKDGKLFQTQRGKGIVPSNITREVKDNLLICTFEAKDVTSIQILRKVD